jgi:hypothetical protein
MLPILLLAGFGPGARHAITDRGAVSRLFLS